MLLSEAINLRIKELLKEYNYFYISNMFNFSHVVYYRFLFLGYCNIIIFYVFLQL